MSNNEEIITARLTDNSEVIRVKINTLARGPQGEPGTAQASFETVSKNLDDDDSTFTFSGSQLASISYSSGIVKTFGYTLGKLTSITLSGSTPDGINLTKTIAYSGDQISSITYS